MKLHQQFDLNLKTINDFGRELLAIPPYIIEEMVVNLTKRSYTVIKSSAHYMGIPQSITVIKDFTGPFVTRFSMKIREDFSDVSKALGIEKLFE